MRTRKKKIGSKATKSKATKIRPGYLGEPLQHYTKLATNYHLHEPEQVKMKLLWKQVMWLVRASIDLSNESNRTLLETFEHQWRIAEQEENRRIQWIGSLGLKK